MSVQPTCQIAYVNTLYDWILVAALGLSVGSFVNVLIWRLPRHESLIRPRSRCPKCGNSLRWYHNIPVLSWLVLRGRCAFCHAKISWVYPVVEMICGALFLVFFARYDFSVATVGFWYLSSTLIAILFIDWEHRIIPNSLSYPLPVIGLAVAFLSPHLGWVQSLIGAVVGFAGFLAIAWLGHALFKKDSLGGGDIKLAAGLGAFLGAWKLSLVLILAAGIGLVVSLAAMAFSAALRRERVIPFGPFLALGALIAGLWGDTIIAYYLQTFVY